MGGVFISYRREDSGGFAGRIYDRLTDTLGHENVFFDVDAIAPGLDFVDVLSDRVGKCDALVAVIGKHWVAGPDGQNRRLDDPSDFVRIEIEAALRRNVPVIPVLVDGAAMPEPDDLPTGMKTLTRRQGIEISHTRFDSDVERLTRALSTLEDQLHRDEAGHAARPVSERSPGSAPVHALETPGPRRSLRSRLIVGAVTSAVAIGAATFLLEHGSRRVSGVREVEYDIDRRGSDYKGFDLAQPDPAHCQASCYGDVQCKAWTFVKEGFQGPKARCWLKNAVPPATPSACCASGFKGAEYDVDRRGADYKNFDPAQPDPALCQASCNGEAECKAWTFVGEGFQGPKARCWLKNAVPPATRGACCVSGFKDILPE